MQASGWAAKRGTRAAIKMLIVQDNRLKVIGVVGKWMKSSGLSTFVRYCVAYFGWKAFDVLGIIAILASWIATLRQ